MKTMVSKPVQVYTLQDLKFEDTLSGYRVAQLGDLRVFKDTTCENNFFVTPVRWPERKRFSEGQFIVIYPSGRFEILNDLDDFEEQ